MMRFGARSVARSFVIAASTKNRSDMNRACYAVRDATINIAGYKKN